MSLCVYYGAFFLLFAYEVPCVEMSKEIVIDTCHQEHSGHKIDNNTPQLRSFLCFTFTSSHDASRLNFYCNYSSSRLEKSGTPHRIHKFPPYFPSCLNTGKLLPSENYHAFVFFITSCSYVLRSGNQSTFQHHGNAK